MLSNNKDRKEESKQREEKQYIKLLYKIKNTIIPNSFILYIAFLVKVIGIILISHIFDDGDNTINIPKSLRKLTCCFNDDISCINKINYIGICVIIYVLIIIPYILFIFALRMEDNKNPKLLLIERKLIKLFHLYN